ncbi:hypothetical protein CEXT_770461 [Caerostris extrusa]|uniref:ATP synthase F0 subunit 8 n=1 Tax=Caerostris extrusa TaxID=172846 RepID=A0AAV4VI63_CAEEX|nr:hypothetical protein CEXT_770461 [Caerostris extrusa]
MYKLFLITSYTFYFLTSYVLFAVWYKNPTKTNASKIDNSFYSPNCVSGQSVSPATDNADLAFQFTISNPSPQQEPFPKSLISPEGMPIFISMPGTWRKRG